MRGVKIIRIGPFSIVELLMVGIVLTVVGASAMPRLSRGSEGVADGALAGNLAVLRNGIDLYRADHAGKFPSLTAFDAQLTQFSDETGRTSATEDETHKLGPYLRKVPVLTVGQKGFRNSTGVVDGRKTQPGTQPAAWWYNPDTGEIRANLSNHFADIAGKAYNQY
jgi:general secretion pathway protein G